MPAGRPKTDRYDIDDMIQKITDYTNDSSFPILKDVCLQNDWNYDTVMKMQRDNEELMQSIKRLLDKKECILEKGVHDGTLDKTMAIFTLKQPAHGWIESDRQRDLELKQRELELKEQLAKATNEIDYRAVAEWKIRLENLFTETAPERKLEDYL